MGAGLLACGLSAHPGAARADSAEIGGINTAIVPSAPCAGDSLAVQFSACVCASRFTFAGFDPSGGLKLVVATDPSIVCVRCDPIAATVPIGRFAAGSYVLAVHVEIDYGHADSVDSARTFEGHLGFQVSSDCVTPPAIRFVQSVHVGGPAPCDTCPGLVCPGDSIPVTLGGEFPQANFTVDHLEIGPPMEPRTLPLPGVVRIFFRQCGVGATVPVPWTASIRLPPLPAGDYSLGVQGFLYGDCGLVTPVPVGGLALPFAVEDSCGTLGEPCFLAGFQHVPDSACDAFVAPNQPAQVTLAVRNTVALAGLQGRFAFDVPGLKVGDIVPIGTASGMLLTWQATADGAKFVLIATSGAPILPIPPAAEIMSLSQPVLRVTVAALDGVPVPDHAALVPLDLVASDVDGHAVPQCSLRTAQLFVNPAAQLCRASACDFNGDQGTDVRDLVVMVHCILDPTTCPAGAAEHLDCNGDGAKDVADVICCARVLLAGLRGGTAGERPAPDVRVELGLARATATGVDVPITLDGLTGVGAARVDFTYPDARYAVSSVDVAPGVSGGWLSLDQANAGKLAVGLIALGSNAGPTVPAVVHLTLRSGQAPGGAFGIEGGEFAGSDGAALTTQVVAASTPLAGGARLVLTAPRPNPFSAGTSFALTVPTAQAVDVAVYDLAGRRVATVFHGRAEAGTTSMSWNRTRNDGGFAASGVYFLRVVADGGVVGSKLLVLSRQ